MKCYFCLSMSELQKGDRIRFTKEASDAYKRHLPSSPGVWGIEFTLMQVMANTQYTFYANRGSIVRQAFLGYCDYSVVWLGRGDFL